ncbi:MAG: hypothetical protein ING19_20675 [Azospirillum sp.]|nr:hypothetical protein [Azospirillum sp.]
MNSIASTSAFSNLVERPKILEPASISSEQAGIAILFLEDPCGFSILSFDPGENLLFLEKAESRAPTICRIPPRATRALSAYAHPRVVLAHLEKSDAKIEDIDGEVHEFDPDKNAWSRIASSKDRMTQYGAKP